MTRFGARYNGQTGIRVKENMKAIVDNLGHIGIPCKNLNRSVAFYQELGFAVDAKKDNLNGYNVAMMRGGNCVIELYQSVEESFSGKKGGVIDHIALACGNVEEAYQKCVESGQRIVTDIEETGIYSPVLCRYFYILGPDGERIEIMQYCND